MLIYYNQIIFSFFGVMNMKMNALEWTGFTLVIIGALNWGLVGLFKFDLVATIFGEMSVISRIIYDLVGLSGIYLIVNAAMKKD